MHSSFLAECRREMESIGLVLSDIIADGRDHRCGTVGKERGRDGSYIVYIDVVPVLCCCNWRTGERTSYSIKEDKILTRAERELVSARIKEAKLRYEEELRRRQEKAAVQAVKIWNNAQYATKDFSYLQKKCIESYGLKVTYNNRLIIPILNSEQKIQSLQFISEDGKNKNFLKDGKVKGGYYRIYDNSNNNALPICIGEGYATMASVHIATKYECYIAFSASNLRAIAEMVRTRYPDREIIVCADNDCASEINIGVQKSTEAAIAVQGRVAIPPSVDGKSLDFNDIHISSGLEAVKNCVVQTAHPQWEEVIPFSDISLPTVSHDALSPIFNSFCEGVSEALQVPYELPFVNVLAVVSTAVQGKFCVRVRDGYREPLNLYLIAPLPPSELKTPTMRLCKYPLECFERDLNAREKTEAIQTQIEQQLLSKQIETLRSQILKATEEAQRSEKIQELIELETQRLDSPPKFTRLLADDATPEALGQLLAENDGKMSHIEAEATLLDNIAGRYSNGKANIDVLLKSYSVEPLRVDRRHSEPLYVSQPHLTVCITPQPYALQARSSSEVFRGRGLDARFLYLLPQSRVGYRKLEPAPLAESAKKAYEDHVRALLEIPQQYTDQQLQPYVLELTPDAYSVWLDFSHTVEMSLRLGGELASLQDWGGKIRGNSIRLSGILHCMRYSNPQDSPVTAETMEAACELGRVFIAHARAMYRLMGESDEVTDAKKALRWIQASQHKVFSIRDCQHALKGILETSVQTQRAVAVLEERHYVALLESTEPKRAGRPSSPQYRVNPAAFKN